MLSGRQPSSDTPILGFTSLASGALRLFSSSLVLIFFLLQMISPVKAFDASPFNTQSAEISQGGWWTLYYDSSYSRNSTNIAAPFAELRYTFFDKLRFGLLSSLAYAETGQQSAVGLSNLILTSEYEIYDFEKNDFLNFHNHELIDHAAVFFNQSMPTVHNELLGNSDYSFNTGIEFQRTLTKHMGLYSEWGYSYDGADAHSLIYKNSISFEIHHWIQPYVELLARTNLDGAATDLLLAPGISFYHGGGYYSYFNPLIGLGDSEVDWGLQLGFTGTI